MYSCQSILECYNLFSGAKLSIRYFCFISGLIFAKVMDTVENSFILRYGIA